MLIAMAITLVMMGAVVTLFANISSSVSKRRATVEMTNQVRHLRNVLQQDLQGATCPGITWQKPESNHGYIEIIEGPYREGNASNLVDGIDKPSKPDLNPEIDHLASILPSSNLTSFKDGNGVVQPNWATDGGALGDYDDTLMLTVRNEHAPFVGRMPSKVRPNANTAVDFSKWGLDNIESPLAEVVWFAIENPAKRQPNDPTNSDTFYGEPGMRTIYRRTLLIAPWVNPYRYTDSNGNIFDGFKYDGTNFKAEPGLVRILPKNIALEEAVAAVIAFQDRYDLSVRLEWDQNYSPGRWKIMANTLADLTKRENRFGHYGYYFKTAAPGPARIFPYPMASQGSGYSGDANLEFVPDPDTSLKPQVKAAGKAYVDPKGTKVIVAYKVDNPGSDYKTQPFVYAADKSDVPCTARAVLNDAGEVVRVIHGPVPLWGTRRGEDVMMSDVLAFDLRVYDPGAPLFASVRTAGSSQTSAVLDVVLTPSDPGWRGTPPYGNDGAYLGPDNMSGTNPIGTRTANDPSAKYPYVGQGAYVDLGYGYDNRFNVGPPPGLFPLPKYAPSFATSAAPWFFEPHGLSDVNGILLAPGYAVYDTWSFHYENDGIDEDANGIVDQGTNGMDDVGKYYDAVQKKIIADTRLGIDDVGERETTPPYDKPLRGMQAVIRTYERDSRSIRQVRVNQHFMPE